MRDAGSDKKAILRSLYEKWGFIAVSTSDLLGDQVARKTEVGEAISSQLMNKKPVGDEVVFGVLKHRIAAADCKLNGFAMEGYPKNSAQLEMFANLKFTPDCIIEVECGDDTALAWLEKRERSEGRQFSATLWKNE